MTFRTEKLEWLGYATGKFFLKMFICFDRMYERDRQIDTQTDRQTLHDGRHRPRFAAYASHCAAKMGSSTASQRIGFH